LTVVLPRVEEARRRIRAVAEAPIDPVALRPRAAALGRRVDRLKHEARAPALPGGDREGCSERLEPGLGVTPKLGGRALGWQVRRGRKPDLRCEPEVTFDELVACLGGHVEDVVVAPVRSGERVDPGRVEVAEVVLAL